MVQALRIWAYEKPDAHQCHLNFHGAVPEPPKILRQTDSRWRVGLCIGWICKRERYLGIYDEESCWGLWNRSMEVLVILVRIRIFKKKILNAWTITKRTMVVSIDKRYSLYSTRLRNKHNMNSTKLDPDLNNSYIVDLDQHQIVRIRFEDLFDCELKINHTNSPKFLGFS